MKKRISFYQVPTMERGKGTMAKAEILNGIGHEYFGCIDVRRRQKFAISLRATQLDEFVPTLF